jgi:hypothetical protein
MLDNLRDQASSSPFFEEELPEQLPENNFSDFKVETPQPRGNLLTSLSAKQRFVLATMLFFTVCIMGAMFLLVLGKITF